MHSFDIHIPKDKLRVAQCISLSLPMGVFLFLAIACLISPFPPQLKIKPEPLTLIVLIQAIVTVPLVIFFQQIFSHRMQERHLPG